MTHSEFNHLLGSIDALSPEQMRQLRRKLDSRLASPAVPGEPSLTEEELADQELQSRLFEAGLLSEIKPPRRVSTGTERFTPIPIQGSPSRRRSSASDAEVATYFLDTSAPEYRLSFVYGKGYLWDGKPRRRSWYA
ncbi:MAG: hypothetical protein ACLP7Q_03455 [Isosphaeraceae bacterium]